VAGLGMLFAWLGYSLAYYGFDQITGGNDSIVSLTWPGKYQVVARDSGSGSGSGSSGSSGSGITGTMVPSSTSTPSKSSSGSAGSKAAQKLF
jgi:hypothetical protein